MAGNMAGRGAQEQFYDAPTQQMDDTYSDSSGQQPSRAYSPSSGTGTGPALSLGSGQPFPSVVPMQTRGAPGGQSSSTSHRDSRGMSSSPGRQTSPGLASRLSSQIDQRNQEADTTRTRSPPHSQQRQSHQQSMSNGSGSRDLPTPPAKFQYHPNGPQQQQQQYASSNNQRNNRPSLSTIPSANEVNGPASRSGSSAYPASGSNAGNQPPQAIPRQNQQQQGEARPSSFFGALDQAQPPGSGYRSSSVDPPQQRQQQQLDISQGRPNSFFGALDSSEEPRASRSYTSSRTSQALPSLPSQHSSSSSVPSNNLPNLRSQSQPSQPRYSHVSQYQQHAQQASTSTASLHAPNSSTSRPQQNGASDPQLRSSFYGLDGHVRNDSDQSGNRNGRISRAERQGPPSSRNTSVSVPRSESSETYGGGGGGGQRRRGTSWASRSTPSSVYGLNAISNQIGDSNTPSVPVLSQAHLRPGDRASLLSHQKTLELYRANVKKTNDPEITFEFASFMLGIARDMAVAEGTASHQASEENLLSSLPDHSNSSSPDPSISFRSRSSGSSADLAAGLANGATGASAKNRTSTSPAPGSIHSTGNRASSPAPLANVNDRKALVAEAMSLLKRNADRGHNPSQYFLADCYAQGNARRNSGPPTGANAILGAINEKSSPSKPDFDKALPLYIAAAKHGHSPSCYKAGQCCEYGWGCRKDATKAVQFYRKAAVQSYPEAMYRLGMADLNGELGLLNNQKEGFKWLKRVAELAESSSSEAQELLSDDPNNPGSNAGARHVAVQALHELALLHERGIENVVFVDNEYAAELLARASELGYAPSAYKLGECYEYGRMGCPQDSALSIHYYNIAAQQNHREACFALTAWYLIGSPGVLPQSDTEAYLWAKKAAEQGLAKAEYAVGYFTEVGIGTHRDESESIAWFRKAAEHGDKRAITRLRTLGKGAENYPSPPTSPTYSHGYMADPRPAAPGEAANGSSGKNKDGKRSRRATLLGMSSGNSTHGAPANGKGGKKADGDCVIS